MEQCNYQNILNSFLERWSIDNIKKMTLDEYVGIKNQDTFCQWVETRTRPLGSINGRVGSIKFGIYKRSNQLKKIYKYMNDDEYTWIKEFGSDKQSVFRKIKENIVKVCINASIGSFQAIDSINLPDIYKWKIAFLYSNERLIPIFGKSILYKIANNFGMQTDKNTHISSIQEIMMQNKPIDLNVYDFMISLCNKYKNSLSTTNSRTNYKDTSEQQRKGGASYIAQQIHNKIQNKLANRLRQQYGEHNVVVEQNIENKKVDIKLIQPDYISFYEIKSNPYAEGCIREALGQILLYSSIDKGTKPKKHIVVGKYPATKKEESFINFLKTNLKLEFEYMFVEIE